ncbi:MAG: hypothetical protein AUJ92_20150 [Armatimonadetes bacterium CG2_30_59_28]|nr:hypothetical protein [Armatimonadota bacterium]OIO89925.1 MAG: hypothetical protein AUJ92_20150 [Armatimonadetes bacterium CG2_30_59_28]PIU66846.1 MAG: hypothetical protein COS85_02865 [Armatimonadetes bacterium CG07_land_8_20_14_0_80_59_28]PIX42101.1 MAG: hypothetical protein COZ56_10190 [Armatimonadetes bacterium CG_4_8_14_3_um_filter_58_9]PIY47435.1 MAG: hypothetical protein COZ05_04980 [Armatimonadetes bacterium CG_4_10_14_3_um_filter_59_10]
MGHNRMWGVLLVPLVAALLTACGGPVKMITKTAWFTVTTAGKIAVKTVAVGAHVASTGVSVGADLLTGKERRSYASQVSSQIVGGFWHSLSKENYRQAYRMFSPGLKSMVSEKDFQQQSEVFAPDINKFRMKNSKVKRRFVEVPTDLLVNVQGQKVKVRATATVIKVGNQWYIDGWKIQDGEKLFTPEELDQTPDSQPSADTPNGSPRGDLPPA